MQTIRAGIFCFHGLVSFQLSLKLARADTDFGPLSWSLGAVILQALTEILQFPTNFMFAKR